MEDLIQDADADSKIAEKEKKDAEILEGVIQEKEQKIEVLIPDGAHIPGQSDTNTGVLTQSVEHDLPGEPEHFAPGELDFKEVAAEAEVIDAVLEPYLGATPDEPDQVVEDEEEKIVFRTAIVGGPPRKIKKTANKISGVEFTLEPAAGGSAEITINRYRKADEVEKEAPETAEAQTIKDGVVVPKGPPPRKPPEAEQTAVPKMMKPTSKELAVAKAALTPPEGTYGRKSQSNKITPAKRASPAAVPAAGPPPAGQSGRAFILCKGCRCPSFQRSSWTPFAIGNDCRQAKVPFSYGEAPQQLGADGGAKREEKVPHQCCGAPWLPGAEGQTAG